VTGYVESLRSWLVYWLVWNPSWFHWTTRVIWAQVREFDHFGDCFCTCALIIWTVPLHHLYLIYYIGMSSPNSLGRRGHPFMGHLCLWSRQRDNEIRVYGIASSRGQGPCLYSPLGSTTALGSNWPWSTIIIDPQRRWRNDLGGGAWLALQVGWVPPPLGRPPSLRARFASHLFLESSRIF
jgi:hypothetical protein